DQGTKPSRLLCLCGHRSFTTKTQSQSAWGPSGSGREQNCDDDLIASRATGVAFARQRLFQDRLQTSQRLSLLKQAAAVPYQLLESDCGAVQQSLHLRSERVARRRQILNLPFHIEVCRIVRLNGVC